MKEIWGKSLVLSSAIASQEHCKTKKSQTVTVELEQQPEKCDQYKTEEQEKTKELPEIGVNNVPKYRDQNRATVKKIPSQQRDMILINISRNVWNFN